MLLDTSGLYALLDPREKEHADAETLYGAADRRLTHSYVLSELVPLARSRGLSMDTVLAFVAGLPDSGEVEVVWVGRPLHDLAIDLLLARPDKGYSLCDAVSFILMRQRGLTEALTLDHHFTQEGFRKLLG